MAMKSVSTLVIFAILFLVVFDVPETEALERKCLKEYGGDVGFGFCAPRIYPSLCYARCRANKGAKGGKCVWGANNVKCFCDYCSDKPSTDLNARYAV